MDEYNKLTIEERIDKPRASPERIRILCIRRMEANKVKYHPDPECTFKPNLTPINLKRGRKSKISVSPINSARKETI